MLILAMRTLFVWHVHCQTLRSSATRHQAPDLRCLPALRSNEISSLEAHNLNWYRLRTFALHHTGWIATLSKNITSLLYFRTALTAILFINQRPGQSGEARIFLIQDDNLTAEVPLRRSILQSTLRQKYRSTGRHNPQRDGGPEKGLYRLHPIALDRPRPALANASMGRGRDRRPAAI